MGGFEHQGGIGTAAGSPDGNDIIAAKGAGVCSHHRHFYRSLIFIRVRQNTLSFSGALRELHWRDHHIGNHVLVIRWRGLR